MYIPGHKPVLTVHMYTKPVLKVQIKLYTGQVYTNWFDSTNIHQTSFESTNVLKTSFESTNVDKTSFDNTTVHKSS